MGCREVLWNPFPVDNETVNWSGECSQGFAEGRGETTWYLNDEVNVIDSGLRQGGKSEGFTVIRYPDGSRDEGSFVDNLLHGVWTYFDENGREPSTITFDNGRRVGG